MDEYPGTPETSETPQPEDTLQSPTIDASVSQASIETQKKKKDFWIGMVGCVIGNLLLTGIISTVGVVAAMLLAPVLIDSPNGDELMLAVMIAIYALPFVVNIGVLIFFLVKHRPGIVVGMLTAYGLGLLLTLISSVLIWAMCNNLGAGY
jgi:hypothetical protein